MLVVYVHCIISLILLVSFLDTELFSNVHFMFHVEPASTSSSNAGAVAGGVVTAIVVGIIVAVVATVLVIVFVR